MMGTKNELISVVLPLYNAGSYIGEAVKSILDQSYGHFELIIINDGSTDDSESIVRSFDDPRIRIFNQPNKGIVAALNQGISMSNGSLIARQDADDISLPGRFEKQVEYLNKHPDVALVGTWSRQINSEGNVIGHHHHPTGNAEIKYHLLFDTPFVHTSVMFRKSALDKTGLYDSDPGIFEDFNLWSRMAMHFQMANIPEELVVYRELSTGLSKSTSKFKERIIAQRLKNFSVHLNELSEKDREALSRSGFEHVQLDKRSRLEEIGYATSDYLNGITDRGSEERKHLYSMLRKRLYAFHFSKHANSNLILSLKDKLNRYIVVNKVLNRQINL